MWQLVSLKHIFFDTIFTDTLTSQLDSSRAFMDRYWGRLTGMSFGVSPNFFEGAFEGAVHIWHHVFCWMCGSMEHLTRICCFTSGFKSRATCQLVWWPWMGKGKALCETLVPNHVLYHHRWECKATFREACRPIWIKIIFLFGWQCIFINIYIYMDSQKLQSHMDA